MTDLRDILKEDEHLPNEQLLRYLNGELSEEDRLALEALMADDTFMNEALEGLQKFKNPQLTGDYAEQLNQQLRKLIHKKERRKLKRRLKEQHWLIIAVLAILLFCVTGYLLLHFYRAHP